MMKIGFLKTMTILAALFFLVSCGDDSVIKVKNRTGTELYTMYVATMGEEEYQSTELVAHFEVEQGWRSFEIPREYFEKDQLYKMIFQSDYSLYGVIDIDTQGVNEIVITADDLLW